jgi:hypothetical protein
MKIGAPGDLANTNPPRGDPRRDNDLDRHQRQQAHRGFGTALGQSKR